MMPAKFRLKMTSKSLMWLVCGWFCSAAGCSGQTFSFSNTNAIALTEDISPPSPASPYPSSLSVTGLAGLVVAKATVTLRGLSHTFPSDIGILLVGPQGQESILMSQTGGQDKLSVTNLTLTLDDAATNSLPIYTKLVSGTFQPTDGYLALGYSRFPYDFPPTAPPGNSNSASALSVFKNTDPNGVWSLFVVDDSTGDSGTLAGGWTVNLTVGVALQIARVQTNVVLSWPLAAGNWSLQSALSAGASNSWSNVATTPTTNLNRLMVTNPVAQRSQFFRLVGN